MAYSQKTTGEHPSRTIVKTMQAGAQSGIFPRVVLLCGKENFLVEWSENYLKSGLVSEVTKELDCSVFSEDAIVLKDIISACQTPAMMSLKRLVIVENSDILSAAVPKDMDAEDVRSLCEYLPSVPEETMLVFTCEKPNKTKALYKAIQKIGIIYDFTPLDDATLGGWMAKRFSAAGKNASKSDMINFARVCGYGDEERNYTLFNLENDLKKIFALYDKNDISLNDMLAASEGQPELNSFKLLDAAFSGRKGEAMDILHASIDSSAPSKETGVIISFLGLLISQIEIMLEGKERMEEGQSYYDCVSAMKINEYRFKKAMASCQNKNSASIKATLDSAISIEKNMKNGDIDGRTALELFIAGI